MAKKKPAAKKKPVKSKQILKRTTDTEVEASVGTFMAGKVDFTSQQIGFIRKNKLKGKSYEEIRDILSTATGMNDGTLLGSGDRFRIWCEDKGRIQPSETLVDAMNADPAAANLLVVEALRESPTIYKTYCTYLSGRP